LADRYSSNGTSLPADEWTLCLFATWLAQDLKVASIKVYLSAVRALHIEQGYTDPMKDCLRLQRVLKGIKRSQGASPDTRLPVTPIILRSIFHHLDMGTYDDVMFWAACCLAYFGFLRSSEFTVPNATAFSSHLHLSVNDVTVDQRVDPSQIQVNIKVSKTDPFRQGCIIALGQGRSPLCPVEAVLSYLSIRGGTSGPLFVRANGVPLTRTFFTERLRTLLSAAGIAGRYSSHSFRIGAATSAALAGVPEHMIQTLGRWTSSAYLTYIRSPRSLLAEFTKNLC
jgi:hypothetical protein